MRYDEFLKYAEEHFLEYMPEEYQNASVDIDLIKNRNEQHYSLSLKKPHSTLSIMPAIRMEPFYQGMENEGISLNDCMRDMANMYQEALDVQETMGVPDLSKENILQHLFTAAVNFDDSDLTDVPYMQVNDLAIIAKSQIMENGVITITDDVAKFLNMDGNEILQMAKENNAKFSKPVLTTLPNLFYEAALEFGREMPHFEELGDLQLPMYVLTNRDATYGASFIADKNVLDMVAETLKDNLLIIPSSIHELIIFPKSGKNVLSLSDYKSIVEDINRTELKSEDILSNNVYVYDVKARELQMYAGDALLQKEQIQSREKKMSGPKL